MTDDDFRKIARNLPLETLNRWRDILDQFIILSDEDKITAEIIGAEIASRETKPDRAVMIS